MTIDIQIIKMISDEAGNPTKRHADIAISDGPTVYLLGVGGLPLAGNLQTILEAREAELLSIAIAKGVIFSVFHLQTRAVVKKLALIMMDEINILRALHRLPARTEAQIRAALKNR